MIDLSKLSILVVDPHSAMRHITASLVRGLGPEAVHLAANGIEAMQQLRKVKVDIVLSEWQMPEVDGPGLLRGMRAEPRLADIPLLLVTADVERSHVAEAIRCGVSDLLVKPYTTQRLLDKISGAIQRGVPAPNGVRVMQGEPAPVPKAQRPVILVVDDTPDNLRLMVDLFSDQYRVKVADNGRKALAICTADAPPDLVLLDVMMPEMDGFEVARRMREHPNSEQIPVIFVTALTDDQSRLKGFDLGAVDFVSKPVEPELLLVRVRNFIRYVQLHKQRQQEFDAMLASARLRDDMDRILREEVRAPMTSVSGHAKALAQDAQLPPALLHHVKQIEDAAQAAVDSIDLSIGALKH